MRNLQFIYFTLFIISINILNFNAFGQSQQLKEKKLEIARLAINTNQPHKALEPLNNLLNYNLSRESELEVMTLLGKTYALLSLDEFCSDTTNRDVCINYVASTTYWYDKIISNTDEDEIFNMYTQAELERFYDNLLTKGVNAFLKENYQIAEFYFDQTYVINKEDLISTKYAMVSSEASNHYEKALTYSNQLLKLGYDSTDVYESRAFFYEQLGQPDLALAEVQKGISKHPNEFALIYRGVGICIREKWYDKALTILNAYVKKDSFNTNTLIALGMIYEELNDNKRAVLNYTKAIHTNPFSFDAYFNLGQLQFRQAIEKQKILFNWNKLKKTTTYKNVHKSDIRKIVKFHLEQCVLNLNKAFELDRENEEVLTTLRNAYGLLNKTKELKRIDDTLDSM